MSWGLIPVITKQCGYTDLEKVVYIPLNNLKGAEKNKSTTNIDQKIIFKIQKNNLKKLIKKYNWENFRKKIDSIVVKKNKKKLIKYTQKEIKVFENYKKNSPIII